MEKLVQYGMRRSEVGIVLIVLVLAFWLSACGQRGTGSALPGDSVPGGSAAPADSTQRIHAMLNNIVQDWEGQAEFVREFRRRTGVELVITQPPHQSYSERVLLQLVSTSVPDIIEILPEYLPRLVQGDQIIPLNAFIAGARYMSSVYPAYMESVRHPNGSIYGIPARDGGGCVTYIRADWLENLGLSMPTTYAELERVMHAFTTMDPNRSGVDDTVAYTDVAGAAHDWYNRLILGEGRVEIYYDYDRELWVDGLTETATRVGLERLKRWYDAGYIDPDITTNTTFSARTKFINGQAGIFTYWANHWARNLQDRTAAADSTDARIVPMPALEGVRYIRRVAPLLVITTASPHPHLVFEQFIDRQYDKGPMQMLFTFGVEGFHYDRTPAGIAFRPNLQDPYGAAFTKAYVPPGSQINDWELPMQLDPLVAQSIAVLDNSPYHEKQRWGGPMFSQYFVEIEQNLKPDVITAYLTGSMTLDEALAWYGDGAQRLYLNEILAELNGTAQ